MPTPTEWLNEFQVNTGTAATGAQSHPKIIGLANGHIVVAWEESADGLIGTDPGTDIVAKIFDAEGNVVRDAFQLNQFATANDEHDFELTAIRNDFAIAFIDRNISNPDQTTVVYERFDSNGDPTSAADNSKIIATEDSTAGFLRNPQIAAKQLAFDDTVFIAYDESSGTGTGVNARIMSKNDVLSAAFGIDTGAAFNAVGDTAIDINGRIVTVYGTEDSGVTGIQLAITTPTGTTFQSSTPFESSGTNPSVAGVDRGGAVVPYERGGDVKATFTTLTGGTPKNFFVTSGPVDQNQAVVASLPADGFVIAWNDDTNGTLLARKFSQTGTGEGRVVTVAATTTTQTDISTTGDGRLLFTWIGVDNEVFASIWDPRDSRLDTEDYSRETPNFLSTNVIATGLTGSLVQTDSFFGTEIQSFTVLGQGGYDIIYSSGIGSYFGGAGDDLIYAGELTGPTDFELLDGGAGIDTLNTTKFRGNYTVNLVTGETDYFGRPAVPVESFVNFENIVMSRGDDTIIGTDGDNFIDSGPGSDTIDAGDGDDTIFARAGNDIILASLGSDKIWGGDGNDTISTAGFDRVVGGNGNDTIIVTSGLPQSLKGESGTDTLDTRALGRDFTIFMLNGQTDIDGLFVTSFENLFTGGGHDVLFGSNIANRIHGGDGNDQISGQDGADALSGGTGDDILYGGRGNDTLEGGAGNDRLFGGIGSDEIYGGTGDDLLIGKAGNDNLVGHQGKDTIIGNFGDDFLEGGNDDDELFGGEGNDNLDGGNGDDLLYGGTGDDFLAGWSGDDTLIGLDGNDTLVGGNGYDLLRGGEGDDFLTGGNQPDWLFGGAGNDTLLGGADQDTLSGGDGDDFLTGGVGRDFIHGGAGDDTFIFTDTSDSNPSAGDLIYAIEGVGVEGGDVLDLSGIDADVTANSTGDQSFTFLGAVSEAEALAFGAGALWLEDFSNDTLLRGLTDNDNDNHLKIDFFVWLVDYSAITASDYIASDFIL